MSRDPGHAHLWVVLWSIRREAPFSMSVPNLKRIAFRSKVIRGSQISPRRRPLPGGAGRPKFNQLDMMVTTFTYKPSLVRIDSCIFELSW